MFSHLLTHSVWVSIAVLFSLCIFNPDTFFVYFLSCDPGKTESKEGSRQEVVHVIETLSELEFVTIPTVLLRLVWVPLHELMW